MRLTADLRMVRHSGIGRYLRNLLPPLLPLLQADHIRVLGKRALFQDASWLEDPRIQFVETPEPIYSIAEQALGLRGVYRDSDLLWVPHYNAPLVYSGRMVVTIHDIAPVAVPAILSSEIKRKYARLLITRALQQASALLCVSQFTQSEIVSRFSVPLGKTTVTPLGIEGDWALHGQPHQEHDAAPYLLFVGNVKPNKNLALLLTAFSGLLDRLPYRLLIVGRNHGFGTGDDAVLRHAAAMGDRVRFTGEVTDAQLIQIYAGASALILPSLYEGFGLPLLEAMKLNCPVLASTAGSLPEIAADAALTFDPHSVPALSHCLLQTLDPTLMDTLRGRGRERVQHFSFQRCAHQTATVMNRLLQRNL